MARQDGIFAVVSCAEAAHPSISGSLRRSTRCGAQQARTWLSEATVAHSPGVGSCLPDGRHAEMVVGCSPGHSLKPRRRAMPFCVHNPLRSVHVSWCRKCVIRFLTAVCRFTRFCRLTGAWEKGPRRGVLETQQAIMAKLRHVLRKIKPQKWVPQDWFGLEPYAERKGCYVNRSRHVPLWWQESGSSSTGELPAGAPLD